MRYELSEAGGVLAGAVLLDMTDAPGEDAIDGIKVDVDGNLYVCGPGGIWYLAGRQAARPDRAPRGAAQPRLRRGRRRDLYVTALTGVYRLRLDVPGITRATPERSTR